MVAILRHQLAFLLLACLAMQLTHGWLLGLEPVQEAKLRADLKKLDIFNLFSDKKEKELFDWEKLKNLLEEKRLNVFELLEDKRDKFLERLEKKIAEKLEQLNTIDKKDKKFIPKSVVKPNDCYDDEPARYYEPTSREEPPAAVACEPEVPEAYVPTKKIVRPYGRTYEDDSSRYFT